MPGNFDLKVFPTKLALPKRQLASSKSLQEFEEVVGTPIAVVGNTVYFDKIGGVLICDELFLKKIKGYIGKKIAILCTDNQNNRYLLRGGET